MTSNLDSILVDTFLTDHYLCGATKGNWIDERRTRRQNNERVCNLEAKDVFL